jgi:pilus assembly protein CpaC
MSRHSFHRSLFLVLATGSLLLTMTPLVRAQVTPPPPNGSPTVVSQSSIVRKLQSTSEQMEMTVNTSRILELDQKIPQAQVNNPDLIHITPLAPNQVQIAAKKAGVTQVNIWAENKQIYTVDVIIRGDARELAETLEANFPTASLKVVPVANSVMISGFVAEPEQVNHIIRIAEEFYPKVINNITVGGVQQVLLHVRVMEVSRTKLRTLGFDFAKLTGNNMVTSGISGLLPVDVKNSVMTNVAGKNAHADLFNFQIIHGSSAFLGLLEALREDKLLKVLAEPTLVTISGRPAQFNVGGEIPILVPQSLGTTSIDYKKYGTQLDFVPIVLGNGKIRLEVRPKISELDPASSVVLNGVVVPGLLSREVETGVEMNAGQTLAIGGLVQTRLDAERRGLPWVSDLPYVGMLFRRTEDTSNEIELLILVTPQLVDPLDPDEVPPCGPGLDTTTPTDWEMYMKGHLEVPKCCGQCGGKGCDQCNSGKTVKPEGNGGELPGMINQPTPTPEDAPTPAPQSAPAKPVAETAARSRVPSSYNPANPQTPQAANNPSEKKPLPGFMGQVGYETVR